MNRGNDPAQTGGSAAPGRFDSTGGKNVFDGMKFHFRLVPFGTSFEASNATRKSAEHPSHVLCRNEVAVDVGGECHGYRGCEKMVLDHHFHRADGWNFPAAAAAVLHHADLLRACFQGCPAVWLVTHTTPDFDALGSVYLARKAIEGAFCDYPWEAMGVAAGEWKPVVGRDGKERRIDWFDPFLRFLPMERRWPFLLAACASRADNTRPFACGREHSLPAMLYAAQYRGRDLGGDAAFFFDAAVARIREGLNPLVDALFDRESAFAPELALLEKDLDRYHEDLRKARRCLVNIPYSKLPFDQWFEKPKGEPLVLPDLSLNPAHLQAGLASSAGGAQADEPGEQAISSAEDRPYRQVEGIFIRDPQSLLFKDWARADTLNTLHGSGFVFTCVARSNANADALTENRSRYWIALDMERAEGLHLYPVWAELQYEELRRRPLPESSQGTQSAERPQSPAGSLLALAAETTAGNKPAREGFTARSLATDDPWFDGHNYRATIIDTPGKGTCLREGLRSDLANDEVAELVFRRLREPFYRPFASGHIASVLVEDFPTSREARPCFRRVNDTFWREMLDTSVNNAAADRLEAVAESNLHSLRDAVGLALSDSCFRFAVIPLGPGADFNAPGLPEQIARELWPLLEPQGVSTVPSDFLENHFHRTADLLVLWSRRGLVIGLREGGAALDLAERYRSHLVEMAACGREIEAFLEKRSRPETMKRDRSPLAPGEPEDLSEKALEEGKSLLNRLTSLKLRLQAQELRALGKLFDACRFHEVVGALHAVNQEEANRLQARRREETAEREKTFERLLMIFVFGLGFPSLALALVQAFGTLYAISEREPALSIGLNRGFLAFLLAHPFAAFLAVAALLLPFLIALAIWAAVRVVAKGR